MSGGLDIADRLRVYAATGPEVVLTLPSAEAAALADLLDVGERNRSDIAVYKARIDAALVGHADLAARLRRRAARDYWWLWLCAWLLLYASLDHAARAVLGLIW